VHGVRGLCCGAFMRERGLITLDESLDAHLPEVLSLPIIAASGEKKFFELPPLPSHFHSYSRNQAA
jgi:hypothetical protein